LLPAVSDAIDEVRANFADQTVVSREDGEGGAYVIVEDVSLTAGYSVDRTWVGFRITFTYPNADVYPHYVRGDLVRLDGRPMPFGATSFEGRPALQVSRKSNRWDPRTDTAAIKLQKVLAWLTDPR
jgi:hypothetical protein